MTFPFIPFSLLVILFVSSLIMFSCSCLTSLVDQKLIINSMFLYDRKNNVWSIYLLFDKVSHWNLSGLLTWRHKEESREEWICLDSVSPKHAFLGMHLIAVTVRNGKKYSKQKYLSRFIVVFQNIFWSFHLAASFDSSVVLNKQ